MGLDAGSFITIHSPFRADYQHVLFLGNSYTAANNLPQMISDAALSAGDTVVFEHNLPGGYTFQMHATNTATLSKIAQGVGIMLYCRNRVSALHSLWLR